MVRLGGASSPTYVSIFRGLQAHFLQHDIKLDWVIYSDYDALVEAFARREIDLAWNAPLAYVKTKRAFRVPVRWWRCATLMSTSRRILSRIRTRLLPRSRTSKESESPWEAGARCKR